MNSRVLSAVTLLLLLLNATGFALAGPDRTAPRAQTDPLLRLLPESDAVALIDSRRLFDTALPTVLASKPALLSSINAKLDEVQQKTSILKPGAAGARLAFIVGSRRRCARNSCTHAKLRDDATRGERSRSHGPHGFEVDSR